MEKINGIIENGKIYKAVEGNEYSCLNCDLMDNTGMCDAKDYCLSLGKYNYFRYSPELTDKLKGK